MQIKANGVIDLTPEEAAALFPLTNGTTQIQDDQEADDAMDWLRSMI